MTWIKVSNSQIKWLWQKFFPLKNCSSMFWIAHAYVNTIVLEIAKTILIEQSKAFHDAKEDVFKDFSSTIFFSNSLFSFVKFLRLDWDYELTDAQFQTFTECPSSPENSQHFCLWNLSYTVFRSQLVSAFNLRWRSEPNRRILASKIEIILKKDDFTSWRTVAS